MNIKSLLVNDLYDSGIKFFCGVPDSLLANFSRELENTKKKLTHIITPNEGNAVGAAIGYYLSTNNLPLVYMQNSGFGNAINPLVSLAGKSVWQVPIFLLIGWRGSHKLNDEPQHLEQGKITLPLLKLMKISYLIYSKNIIKKQIETLKNKATKNSCPVALVFPEKYLPNDGQTLSKSQNPSDYKVKRIEVIEEVVKQKSPGDILISTTGKTSRELYLTQEKLGLSHNDLFVVGGMGHASSIVLGILKSKSRRRIYLLDGDGAFLMHMGIIALLGPQNKNAFYHILLNNESHDSVGGQPTTINNLNLKLLAKACNYKVQKNITKSGQLSNFIKNNKYAKGSFFFNVAISRGSFSPLPRPKDKPKKNIELFKKKFESNI